MVRNALFIITLGLFPFCVQAQRLVADTDTISRLSEVVITAERKRESIIPPQVIEKANLEKLNSLSIADAMRYFSGVQIKDYGGVGGIKTINIRSMGSQHVGIFYDGIELSNAQNGQIDLGQYSLSNMEAIELYNGQKGGLLQPAKDFGSSGTVYLRTRRPIFNEGSKQNIHVTYKTGSFDLINPAILWEQRLGLKNSISLSSEYIYSSGKYKFRYRRINPLTHKVAYDTVAIRQNGDINALRLEATLFGAFVGGKYYVKTYNYISNRGIPGAIVNNVWRRGERMSDANSFVQTSYEQTITNNYRLKAIAKYAYYYTHYVNNDPTTIQIDNQFHQQEAYFSLSQSLQLTPHWYASLAYDYQWNKLNSDIRDFVWPQRNSHLLAASTTLSFPWIDVQGSLLATFINDYTKVLAHKPKFRVVTPALLATFYPFVDNKFRIDAFYKRSFRMPTFNDLYYTDIGNSKLLPERTQQFNLTVSYNQPWEYGIIRGIELSASGYYNRVNDKIVAYPKGQQFRWTMLNLGKVDIKGTELAFTLHTQLLKDIVARIYLQYTFQRAIDITSATNSYYRHQIPYIPLHSGSATCWFNYKQWQLNYSFIYVGERYNQRENTIYNYSQPWYTSDISLSYNYVFNNKHKVRVQFEANNLFNQQYDVIINYPMPGRSFRLTLMCQI